MKKQVFFRDKTNSFNTLEKPLAEICAYLHIDIRVNKELEMIV